MISPKKLKEEIEANQKVANSFGMMIDPGPI